MLVAFDASVIGPYRLTNHELDEITAQNAIPLARLPGKGVVLFDNTNDQFILIDFGTNLQTEVNQIIKKKTMMQMTPTFEGIGATYMTYTRKQL